jgi:ABC-type multidrug transport system fused ATPase/permease subunit
VKSFIVKLASLFNRREKMQIGVILGLMAIAALLETFTVGIIPAFVALLGNPELVQTNPVLNWLYRQGRFSSTNDFLLWGSFALIGIYVAKSAYIAALIYGQQRFLYNKLVATAARLFSAYLHKPYTFHLQHNTAQLIRNINYEVEQVFVWVLVPCLSMAAELMAATFLALLLIVVEPVTAAIATLILGVAMAIFNQFIRKNINEQGQIRQHYDGKMIQWVSQGLGGIKETKILGREDFFVAAFQENCAIAGRSKLWLGLTNYLPNIFIETLVIVAVLAIVATILAQGRPSQSVLPILSLFAIASLRLMPSVKRIVGHSNSIRFYTASLDAVYQDLANLNKQTTAIEKSSPAALLTETDQQRLTFRHQITIENIAYKYPNASSNAIQNVSLKIPKGASIGLVGASGSGKTTLADLILGLLTPDRGQVLVDGQDIYAHLDDWQNLIGYIPQEVYLSDDTLLHNVAFGLDGDHIDRDRVWQAITAAQLDSLVEQLPDRLDTILGEHGTRLSGGQKQRVGIARALYHDPEILVMDEATAALDNITETEFVKALESISHQKTIITIAHRLSTIKDCDRLYFLQHGKILASGNYDQLLATCAEFKAMVEATHHN